MVLDTSAIVAILLPEPERDNFLLRLNATRLISTVSLLELEIVLSRSRGASVLHKAASFLSVSSIQPVAFNLEQSALARQAFYRFGKGRHPSALNFGDCITTLWQSKPANHFSAKATTSSTPISRSFEPGTTHAESAAHQ